jgi:glyoxylate reductase
LTANGSLHNKARRLNASAAALVSVSDADERTMSQRILLTRRMPTAAAEVLAKAGLDPEVIETDEPAPRDKILERARGCAGLITMLSDRIDAEFLDAVGPSLRVVANYAVGFDNIDLEACKQRGVRVTNTPGVLTEATADLAWALILAAARNVAEGDRAMRSGKWPGWAPTQLLGLELNGATLGILGAGRIGTAVARRSIGFRMRVLYTDTRRNEELEREVNAERVELDRLISESDVLSLHIPMTADETDRGSGEHGSRPDRQRGGAGRGPTHRPNRSGRPRRLRE